MNRLGHAALILSLVFSLYGIAPAALAGRVPRLGRTAGKAALALAVSLGVAAACLVFSLVSRDFSNVYVYQNTSRDLPLVYTIAAFWAGNAGSLLLWLVVLGAYTAIVARRHPGADNSTPDHATVVLLVLCAFFAVVILVVPAADPFAIGPAGRPTPTDGLGMNPILINPGMVVHPVALYLGYVALAVPFALVFGGLLGRRPWNGWIGTARNWTLFAWLLLTAGNVIGAWWAYVTLGWGGYWAWDPVENASLMPWLTATALLHSMAALQKRDLFPRWTAVLAASSFLLTIFGTLVTRSGVTGSVHSFGDTSLGPLLLSLLAVTLLFSVVVLVLRRNRLAGGRPVQHVFSRDANLLAANVLPVLMAALILWGVTAPMVREAVSGQETVLGAPFYNRVVPPAAILLMLVMAVCPSLGWNATPGRNAFRALAPGLGAALVCAAALLAGGVRHGYAVVSFALCAAVVAAALSALAGDVYARASGARASAGRAAGAGAGAGRAAPARAGPQKTGITAAPALPLRPGNSRRYSAFLVHIGLAVLLAGVTGSYAFRLQAGEQVVERGASVVLGDYAFTYDGLSATDRPGKVVTAARISVRRGTGRVAQLTPVREDYAVSGQTWTRVAIDSTAARDLYVSLLDNTEDGSRVLLQIGINPMVSWIWAGGAIMGMGGIASLLAKRARSRRAGARAG